MQIPREPLAVQQATECLADILGVASASEDAEYQVGTSDGREWDAVLWAQGRCFVLEWKRSSSFGAVTSAIRHLEMVQSSFSPEAIPLLAVPYMGKPAQELCAETKLAWLDLSGNARIVLPGIFYQNLGNPNRFRRSGRPESAFGPKGSRVARILLMEPPGTLNQREIAYRSGLSEGHASRIVRKLLEVELVERGDDGISIPDRGTLLDAWREEYSFRRQNVIRGHIPARAGESLTRSIAEALDRAREPYAATALPAAWLWTRFAGFRLSTVYISRTASLAIGEDLGFREEGRGANTWLVLPNDDAVFDGAKTIEGIRCVHPLQAYLDLKDHPERAEEAAIELRSRLLQWDIH